MRLALDDEVRAAADQVAEAGEQLGEQGDRVGLGVRRDDPDEVPGQAV